MTIRPTPGPGLLSLPPELIHNILLRLLRSKQPHPSPYKVTITSFNEETLTDLNGVPSLQPYLDQIVEHVDLDWTSTIAPRTLSRISPFITTLSISHHRLAASYIAALERAPLRALRLVGVTVPPFLPALARAPPHLKELSLSFVTTTFACHDCFALEKLELAGVTGLTHGPLVSLFSPNLKSLHLSYLRHPTINDLTLLEIVSCHNLKHLTLSYLRNCTSGSIYTLLTHFCDLQSLTLAATRIPAYALCSFLQSASDLRHLSLEEPLWTTQHTEYFVQNFNNQLTSFELRNVPGIKDADVRCFVNRMQNLESLSLRRHSLLSVFSAMDISTLPLKKLNLRGVFLSDPALSFLSDLSLQEVLLGGDGEILPNSQASPNGHVSNDAMEKLLRRSPNLEKFFWESPRWQDGSTPVQHPAQLDAKTLARMLKRHCAKLRRVEVNWLRPRVANIATRAEAARCDLAFLELEEATEAVVLLDEKPLY